MSSPNEIEEMARHAHWHKRHLIKVPFILAAVVLVKSAVLFYLWNSVVPELFHGPVLTYLQAIKLAILAKLFFGFGLGLHGRHSGHHKWKEHWMALSPEERAQLREQLHRRWSK